VCVFESVCVCFQIWINGRHIGGADDLHKLDTDKQLVIGVGMVISSGFLILQLLELQH
jgi:hypothetical protein